MAVFRYIDLLDLATDMGVWVDEDRAGWLQGGQLGGWFSDYGLVLLRRGLSPVQELCTLAHELGHAYHRHDSAATGWWSARQEQQADQFAVELLISPGEYALAENLYGPNKTALAHELGVTTRLIDVFQATYIPHFVTSESVSHAVQTTRASRSAQFG